MFLEACGPLLRDVLLELVHPGPKVGSFHFCLPTCYVLIQGIMEEHILGLEEGHATPTCALAGCTICLHSSYPCLYHEDTPLSHVLQLLVDVDGALPHLKTLCYGIQYYEGSCTPHPRTAVDQEGNPLALVMGLLYPPHKAENGGGRLGYPMVRPGGDMEVSYLKRFCIRFKFLCSRGRKGHVGGKEIGESPGGGVR